MAMNYVQFCLRLASFVSIKADDIDYSIVIPATIDAAEQRCYRDLDLLTTIISDASARLTPNARSFTLPTDLGTFLVLNQINVVSPPTATTANEGTRNQLAPVSRDFLDAVWNAPGISALPLYYARADHASIIVGPWPDANYLVEVTGTMRPQALSQANPTTFLTTYLPDAFFAAAMVFFARAVMEYGAATQNGPEFWEAQYQTAKASASAEEMRKKFASGDWHSQSTPNA